MGHNLQLEAERTAKALAIFAELLGNQKFVHAIERLDENPEDRQSAGKDPRGYFSRHGVDLSRELQVGPGGGPAPKPDAIVLCIIWKDTIEGPPHGCCVTIDGNGIQIKKW